MSQNPASPGQISGQSQPVPLIVAPTFPSTTVFVQNTNPYPVMAHINVPAAGTVTHLYLNKTGSTTGAVDIGANFAATTALNFPVLIPAGWYFRMDYSGATPTWTWAGGL